MQRWEWKYLIAQLGPHQLQTLDANPSIFILQGNFLRFLQKDTFIFVFKPVSFLSFQINQEQKGLLDCLFF